MCRNVLIPCDLRLLNSAQPFDGNSEIGLPIPSSLSVKGREELSKHPSVAEMGWECFNTSPIHEQAIKRVIVSP